MSTLPHLIFRLRGAQYGTEAPSVREVFLLPELTPVAGAPRPVVGVLNFRGKVIPVLDLALRMGYPSRPYRITDTVIVVEREAHQLGVVVEEVLEVVEIAPEETEPAPFSVPPSPGGTAPALRVAKVDGEIITLIDVDDLLAAAGDASLQNLAEVTDEESEPPDALDPADQALFRERARRLGVPLEEGESGNRVPIAVVSLNDEYYGVELGAVREFADARQVTPVPCCPEHVVGAVNLRGEILTLVDVRHVLHLPAPAERTSTQMMVVQLGEFRAGIMVDAVLDILHLDTANTAPVPYSVKSLVEEHVSGTAPYAGKMLAILDLPGIFAREDWIVDLEA